MNRVALLGIIAPLFSWAITPIPTHLISAGPARTPIESLKAITKNSQYVTCKDDLKRFLSTLTPAEEKELFTLRGKFDAKKLKFLMNMKKREFATAAAGEVSINQNMKSGHFLVVHGRLKCQISVYTEMDSDGVKVNVDPTAGDLKIYEGFLVDATLVGASADASTNADVHMDPSKVLTILKTKLDVANQREQIKILEELHEAELRSATQPASRPVK